MRNLEQAADALFDPHANFSPLEMEAFLEELASAAPWYDAARGRWLVGRWSDVRDVLSCPELRNDLGLARPSTKSDALAKRLKGSTPPLLFVDPPVHTRARRLMSELLSTGRTRTLSPAIRAHARACVDAILCEPSFDLCLDLTQPYAAHLAMQLLHFQCDDLKGVVADLFSLNRLFDLTCTGQELEQAQAANARVLAFVERQVSENSDLMGRIDALHVPWPLAVSSLLFALRAAVVTTSCLLGAILLRRSGSDAVPGERILKSLALATPTFEAGRVTVSSFRIGGTEVPPRETIMCLLPAANRDMLRRGLALAGHMTFGSGRHRCSGAPAVRLVTEALVEVVERTGKSILPIGEVTWHSTGSFRGPYSVQAVLE